MMLAAMAVMVLLFAGVALAAAIEGTSAFDILVDSNGNDTMFGRGAGDILDAGAFGPDGFLLNTDPERDVANGNAGNDLISVDDGDGRDTANGGNGNNDICFSDPNDDLISCEQENPENTVASPVR
jgi:hypothetical protein